jgi:hypothetical protein
MWLHGMGPLACLGADPAAATPEALEFFEHRIRPVLVEHCYKCHSPDADVVKGGLRLDTAELMRQGGDSGPAIVPGDPQESLLMEALRYESFEMPPDGKLPDAVIADFETWIDQGAADPRAGGVPAPPPLKADAETHWSFQAPKKPSPPAVAHPEQAPTPIDAFVVARLDQAKLAPSKAAAPRVLLRRLYYDLTGLPPTLEEQNSFADKASDSAYQQAVDHLLASPRFGERWGRYWLDVARYADTKGYVFEEDRNYPNAYKYRDWVIAALNGDMPFDRFAVAQLAADQLNDAALLPAMGFLTLGRRFLNDQTLINDDRIDIISRGFMGLTAACARCHDHKYDPIPTADYYSLYGVLASSQETPHDDNPPTLVDKPEPVQQTVFLRGNPGSPGPAVPRQFFKCLAKENRKPFEHGSGRMELAEAIASRDNPLTARVWVNRVWGHLFGRGLVATASDFGARGALPTHPELLDWLACTFVEDGWSTKQLIRRIVLSNTYRQASDLREDGQQADAENQLVWRMNRRRLDLEAFRDSLLAAAGRLDLTMGGPSVQVTAAPFSTRRSVYGFIERQNLPAFFRTFDFSNPSTHTPQRPETASPTQALFFLNSPFVLEQAQYLAQRSEKPVASTSEEGEHQRVRRLYQCALSREPGDADVNDATAFVQAAAPPDAEVIVGRYPWRFGWGVYDALSDRVVFHPMPTFVNNAWQGGPLMPDPQLGWAMLNPQGGHPGDPGHQVIRRWVAPAAGDLAIDGQLIHQEANGDGVRGRIVLGSRGRAGEWVSAHGQTATQLSVPVQAGETIDLVVDCRGDFGYDTFSWPVTIRLQTTAGDGRTWQSQGEFSGEAPPAPVLTRWEELAHVLLMSNEFMFVD